MELERLCCLFYSRSLFELILKERRIRKHIFKHCYFSSVSVAILPHKRVATGVGMVLCISVCAVGRVNCERIRGPARIIERSRERAKERDA